MNEEDANNRPDMENMPELPGRLGGLAVIISLFLHPGIGIVIAQLYRTWRWALFCIFALLFCGSVCRTVYWGVHTGPEFADGVSDIWEHVSPILITDGKIGWEGDASYAQDLIGWHVSISKEMPEIASGVEAAPYGIAVTEDAISVWFNKGEGDIVCRKVYGERELRNLAKNFSKDEENQESVVFNKEDGKVLAKAMVLSMMFLMLVGNFLYFAWSVFFCILVFFLSSLFMRRDLWHSASDVAIAAVNLCVAPLLVSLAWFAGAPASWSFDSIYFVAFILYVFYVFSDVRRMSAAKERG